MRLGQPCRDSSPSPLTGPLQLQGNEAILRVLRRTRSLFSHRCIDSKDGCLSVSQVSLQQHVSLLGTRRLPNGKHSVLYITRCYCGRKTQSPRTRPSVLPAKVTWQTYQKKKPRKINKTKREPVPWFEHRLNQLLKY